MIILNQYSNMISSFNKDYLKYLIPQRTRLKTEYKITTDCDNTFIIKQISAMVKKDFDMFRDSLPLQAKNILDIGCGLSLIDVALFKYFPSANIHLLDKTQELDASIKISGFNKSYTFYNSMNAAVETLTSNAVSRDNIFSYEVGNHLQLNNYTFDIIISLLSCGWHYSVKEYINLIKNTLDPQGILIIDIRNNTGEFEFIQQELDLIKTYVNINEQRHDGGTVGDRHVFRLKR